MREVGVFKNGLKNGEWRYYSSNSILRKIENYIDGKICGKQLIFSSDGKIQTIEECWEKDEMQDLLYYSPRKDFVKLFPRGGSKKEFFYDEIGKISKIREYEKFKPVKDTDFYTTGEIKSEIKFIQVRMLKRNDFTATEYDKNGKELFKYGVRKGLNFGRWPFYNVKNRDILSTTTDYESGVINGTRCYYDFNGTLRSEENFAYGIKDGLGKYFYSTGELLGEITYKNNLENGWKIVYHKNGNIKERSFFIEGKEQGEVLSFYENGKPECVETFFRGDKQGDFLYYNENGTLAIKGQFFLNKEMGEWKSFNENGELLKSCFYLNGEIMVEERTELGFLETIQIQQERLNRKLSLKGRLTRETFHYSELFPIDSKITTIH